MLHFLTRASDFGRVTRAFAATEPPKIDEALRAVVLLEQWLDSDGATGSVEDTDSTAVLAHVYDVALSACFFVAPARTNDAVPLVRRMQARGIRPADHHCNNVLASCAGHTPPRTRGMEFMLTTMADLGIDMDWRSYRNVIITLCRAKQPYAPRALALLTEMEEAGLMPGSAVYHEVVRVCAGARTWPRWPAYPTAEARKAVGLDRALKLLAMCTERRIWRTEQQQHADALRRTFNAVINACAQVILTASGFWCFFGGFPPFTRLFTRYEPSCRTMCTHSLASVVCDARRDVTLRCHV